MFALAHVPAYDDEESFTNRATQIVGFFASPDDAIIAIHVYMNSCYGRKCIVEDHPIASLGRLYEENDKKDIFAIFAFNGSAGDPEKTTYRSCVYPIEVFEAALT